MYVFMQQPATGEKQINSDNFSFKKFTIAPTIHTKNFTHLLFIINNTWNFSTGVQYVTQNSKIYCGKVKMCRFSSGNWFFCTKFVQLAVAGKRRNTVVHLQKRM
jgi:hypothetical protein